MNPAWQAQPCPSWCEGGHADTDHPDDRVHRSAGTVVAVRSRRLVGVDPLRRLESAHEYEIGLSKDDADGQTWLYIGAGVEEYIEVALADGVRLVEVLRDVIDGARES